VPEPVGIGLLLTAVEVELVIVMIGTVGMTSATQGKEGANGAMMNIYGWIGFWRVFQGIGLGAEASSFPVE
jgi:hypothetical protein